MVVGSLLQSHHGWVNPTFTGGQTLQRVTWPKGHPELSDLAGRSTNTQVLVRLGHFRRCDPGERGQSVEVSEGEQEASEGKRQAREPSTRVDSIPHLAKIGEPQNCGGFLVLPTTIPKRVPSTNRQTLVAFFPRIVSTPAHGQLGT